MSTVKQPLTIETRLPKQTGEGFLCALDAYADLFSRSLRHYHRDIQQQGKVNKPDFMKSAGLTGRQFNAIKVTSQGMVQSRLSNLPHYITQCDNKIKGLQRRLKLNKEKAEKWDTKEKPDKAAKFWFSLDGFRQRIQRLTSQKLAFEAQLASEQALICFGSKKLFKKQFNLKANDYTHHSQWRKDWQDARGNQFFVLGSSDEAGGCQGCTLLPGDDGSWILRLRLPPALMSEFGQYVYLTDITVNYQGHLLDEAVARQRLRQEKVAQYRQDKKAGTLALDKENKPISEATYIGKLGQSLSYRFKRDNKGWRVLISTSAEFEQVEVDFTQGAIGIDFNAGFVSVAELDSSGNKVYLNDIRYDKLNATSAQNKTLMQALAIEVVTQAKQVNKPIVIESLNFKQKKSAMQKGQGSKAQYHKMLSQLSYAAFRQTLLMQCLKQGVALKQVNPAYTSLLGKLKYNRETKFNTHQAAAW